MRKRELLPTQDCEAGYAPVLDSFPDGFSYTTFKPPLFSVKNDNILRNQWDVPFFGYVHKNSGVRLMFRGAGPSVLTETSFNMFKGLLKLVQASVQPGPLYLNP